MNKTPVFKEIILVGGGHAHALLIKQWGMKPLPGVRLILISPQVQTPYSGMLPGLIAGHYNFDDIHIDLPKLCQWAGVRFIQDKVSSINQKLKTVGLSDRHEQYYDLLSLDIGSTPNHSIPGVKEFATPVKPIADFYQHSLQKLSFIKQANNKQEIAVVGGGAGSVEIILAMAQALESNPEMQGKTSYKLIYQNDRLLPGYPATFIKNVERACEKFNIKLYAGHSVIHVEESILYCSDGSTDGRKESFDHLFWCTQANASEWPAQSGLACNEEGFVRVNPCLQAIDNPDVFAVGDIAHMDSNPRPKAGVYAVRQGPYLFENLQRRLLDKPLLAYKPQSHFLSLLALGEQTASGVRMPLPAFSGDWVWGWKNSIDLRFMDKFNNLPVMKTPPLRIPNSVLIPEIEAQEELDLDKRCGGCGGKIGSQTLADVLKELTGNYQAEDAVSFDWHDGTMIQSVDQLKTFIDDPYLFGRITVLHAINDLYAMNAQAHSINIALSLPFSGRSIQKRELRQVMQGVLAVCGEEDMLLLGGHSSEGSDMSLAVTANGKTTGTTFLKQGLQVGDLLILNKPLGCGLLLAALMKQKTQSCDLNTALTWMNKSNKEDALKLSAMEVSACTDISGFGLLGHLSEMLDGSEFIAEIFPDKVPVLPGAKAVAQEGIRSSLALQNELVVTNDKRWSYLESDGIWPILVDPQTSGGLLAGIQPEYEMAAVEAGFAVIGKIKKA